MKLSDLFWDLFSDPDDPSLVYEEEDMVRFERKMTLALVLTVALIGLCVFIYLTVLR